MTNDCIFCAIIAREIPSDVLAENDVVVAIRDNNPQAPVHVLVMPREHIVSAKELTASNAGLWWELLDTARAIAEGEGIGDSGYRLVVNVGREGGQTVGHLHMHVLGGRQMTWPPG